MIISQTPVRVSFLGGGTDYPDYYRRHGGQTLVTAIGQFIYVTVSRLTPFFRHRIGVHYARVERVRTVAEIEHPSVRACLTHLGISAGVEIHTAADLPARTGLGSSSAFTVGLLNALHAFRGRELPATDLAAAAVHVEQTLIGERVGSQDQYACALGGLHRLRFHPDGCIEAERLDALTPARLALLQGNLLLFYTGMQREAHQILEEQFRRMRRGDVDAQLAELGALVDEAVALLLDPRRALDGFGELLHRGWELKKRCSTRISAPDIDRWYSAGRRNGALGGKLLGAGGGGFLLLYVPLSCQGRVRTALAELQEVPLRFENKGTRIIFRQVQE